MSFLLLWINVMCPLSIKIANVCEGVGPWTFEQHKLHFISSQFLEIALKRVKLTVLPSTHKHNDSQYKSAAVTHTLPQSFSTLL